jgi:Cu2+-exporting ATPase
LNDHSKEEVHEHHAARGHDAHTMEMAAQASHDAHAGHEGHDRHAGHSVDMFRNRFWVCLALTIPVLAYAEGLWELVGLEAPDLPAKTFVPFVLATGIFFYGGSVFLRSAVGELRVRMPGMMTLVALGISTAYLYSVATTFLVEGEGFYWELATLVDVMLLGHWIEMSSIGRASEALAELAKLLPDTAERVADGQSEEVAISELSPGDIVLIRPGGRTPADGEVIEGDSHVNEAMLTGESRPVPKRAGDQVIAGTVNEEGALRVKV